MRSELRDVELRRDGGGEGWEGEGEWEEGEEVGGGGTGGICLSRGGSAGGSYFVQNTTKRFKKRSQKMTDSQFAHPPPASSWAPLRWAEQLSSVGFSSCRWGWGARPRLMTRVANNRAVLQPHSDLCDVRQKSRSPRCRVNSSDGRRRSCAMWRRALRCHVVIDCTCKKSARDVASSLN